MDIVNKRRVTGGNGNAAAEYSDIVSRACSWQRGADVAFQDVDSESREEDTKFGVPHQAVSKHDKDPNLTPKGGRTDGVK